MNQPFEHPRTCLAGAPARRIRGARKRAPVVVVGGGQSGLAAARALRAARIPSVILEASSRPTGSWPGYYDSLRLFSPAAFSSLTGMPFPADPGRYPARDEVADYLRRYAGNRGAKIEPDTRAQTIRQEGSRFVVHTADRRALRESGIVAASGSFSNPDRPHSQAKRTSAASSCTSPSTATRRHTSAGG